MNIYIKDDQGLGIALKSNYGTDEINEAKDVVRKTFKKAADIVYSEVLNVEPPETIEVQMAQSRNEELNGEEAAVLASFVANLSTSSKHIFVIRETALYKILEGESIDGFESIVIHELIHSADSPKLSESRKMLKAILRDIEIEECSDFSFNTKISNGWALYKVLCMLDHYRAEGVAILGEYLLAGTELPMTFASIWLFRLALSETISTEIQYLGKRRDPDQPIDELVSHLAYDISPCLVLMIVGRQGNLAKKFMSGEYEPTQSEKQSLLRDALSLSLTEYIEGLLLLDEKIVPVKELLALCGMVQQDFNQGNINQFAELYHATVKNETFSKAIGEIMGSLMSDVELKDEYVKFSANTPEPFKTEKMKDKVESLFWTIENSNDFEKKNIARWALTYLFDDQDAIHDDIRGLGYVDDIYVIDVAFDVINNSTPNT